MIYLKSENEIFVLMENKESSKYCKNCFFQLLSDNYQILSKIECPENINIELNDDEYAVYNYENQNLEKFNIFKVPGCNGGIHNEINYC